MLDDAYKLRLNRNVTPATAMPCGPTNAPAIPERHMRIT